MYLAILSKEEKELFLGLAFALATADGDYSKEEKETIAAYCQEMQMEFDQEKMEKPIDEILGKIKLESNKKTKKIVIFEAIGLAMTDGNYDKSERDLVTHMEKEFGIESDFSRECELALNEYLSFQSRLNQLVLE